MGTAWAGLFGEVNVDIVELITDLLYSLGDQFQIGCSGILAGAFASFVWAMALFVLPWDLLGDAQQSEGAAFIAGVAIVLGAIMGVIFGILGMLVARRIGGPFKERVGTIIGGLVGGTVPWVALLILVYG